MYHKVSFTFDKFIFIGIIFWIPRSFIYSKINYQILLISFILSNFLLIKSNITTFKLLIMFWMQATVFMSESNIIRALSTNVRSICYTLCCSYYVVSYRVYAFELSLLPIVMILLSTNASPSFFLFYQVLKTLEWKE